MHCIHIDNRQTHKTDDDFIQTDDAEESTFSSKSKRSHHIKSSATHVQVVYTFHCVRKLEEQ